jgi:hypothetical protein
MHAQLLFLSMATGMYFEASYRSAVRGFHVYTAVWSPVVGEELTTAQEPDNPEDKINMQSRSTRMA